MYAVHHFYAIDPKTKLSVEASMRHLVATLSAYANVTVHTDEDSMGNTSADHEISGGFNITAICGADFQTDEISMFNFDADLCESCNKVQQLPRYGR